MMRGVYHIELSPWRFNLCYRWSPGTTRYWRTQVRLLPLLGLMLLSLIGSPTLAQQCARGTLTAEVTHVRDGDTIEVGGCQFG